MTEATFASPRLERPIEAPLGGVCLALARTTGTDVVLWRVLFVVLTVFGGLGAALYLACYVTIPVEGQQHSLVSRLLHGPDRRVTTRQVLLLVLVLLVTVAALHDNGGAVVAVGLAGLAFLWWRRRHPSPMPQVFAASAAPAPVPEGPAEDVVAPGTEPAGAPTAVLPPYQPVWTPPAPRRRSVLTPLVLSSAALAVGALLLVAAAGTASVPTELVLAVALGVVGLGLVASAFFGRARGLVPVAFLLALALGGTFAARPGIDHGIGERKWVVSSTGAFRLGIGDATLTIDPRLARAGTPATITARVTLGHLLVRVPPGVRVVVDARVQTGEIQADGGVDENGRRVHRTFVLGPEGAPQVLVDARVGTGMVEVRSA